MTPAITCVFPLREKYATRTLSPSCRRDWPPVGAAVTAVAIEESMEVIRMVLRVGLEGRTIVSSCFDQRPVLEEPSHSTGLRLAYIIGMMSLAWLNNAR